MNAQWREKNSWKRLKRIQIVGMKCSHKLHIESDYACKNPAIYHINHIMWLNGINCWNHFTGIWRWSRADAFLVFTHLLTLSANSFALFRSVYNSHYYLSMGSFFSPQLWLFSIMCPFKCIAKRTMQRIGDGDDICWFADNI